MIDYLMNKTEKQRAYIGIVVCAVFFFFGYYILNVISSREKLPLGNTFGSTIYIVTGSALMAFSAIGFLLIIRYLYKLEKKRIRRSKQKIVFLKDQQKKVKKTK